MYMYIYTYIHNINPPYPSCTSYVYYSGSWTYTIKFVLFSIQKRGKQKRPNSSPFFPNNNHIHRLLKTLIEVPLVRGNSEDRHWVAGYLGSSEASGHKLHQVQPQGLRMLLQAGLGEASIDGQRWPGFFCSRWFNFVQVFLW